MKDSTARHVLTHTTGLPNWGTEFQADPGERYGYSGEGFAYLGRVLEEISGLTLDDLGVKEIFEPLGMTRSSPVWFDGCETNGTVGHDRHGNAVEQRRYEANGGASLVTTGTDYARFLIGLMDGTLLSDETLDQMLAPQVKAMEWDGSGESEHITWGLGWGLQPAPAGHSFWHWGNNVDVRGYSVADRHERSGGVYFANSENGRASKIVGMYIRGHRDESVRDE
jgi:CubicO group peptidase (beta-lactamase class C family)